MRDIRGVPIMRTREFVHIHCTFRVAVSVTKTFYVSYSDINLSIHCPPLIAVKLEPIMYSTDIKWKMLRRRKKKTFEDLKKKSFRTCILPWLYGNGYKNKISLFEILQIKWSIDEWWNLNEISRGWGVVGIAPPPIPFQEKWTSFSSLEVSTFIYWVSNTPILVESFTFRCIHMYSVP